MLKGTPRYIPVCGVIVAGLWLLASSLDHQELVARRQDACAAKGPGWTADPRSLACVKPIRPECEPPRHHKPTTPRQPTPENCYAPR